METPINKKKSIYIHLVASLFVLGLPFMVSQTEDWTIESILFFLIPSLLILILFYANYNVVIEKFLFPKRYAAFVLSNIGLLTACMLILNSSMYRDIRRDFIEQSHIQALKDLSKEDSKKEEYRLLRKRLNEQRENKRLERKAHRTYKNREARYMSGFLLVGFISILTSIGIRSSQHAFSESSKLKLLENEYLKSQNAFLSYQIQPHFFFNTLNSIHALIDISKDQAKQTLIDLSRLMRYVLNVSEQDEVSLQKEIDFLKNYCDLMRLRVSDDFNFTFDVSQQPTDRTIAPLLLIVLVENAFKHGVSGLDSDFIHIACTQSTNEFVFTVSNSRYKNEVQTSADSSIGIENLKTRLQLMYPNTHTLDIKEEANTYTSTLTITS